MEIDDIVEEDLLNLFNTFEASGHATKEKNSHQVEKTNKDGVALNENFEVEDNSVTKKSTTKVLEIDSDNVDSFALLLKELLNNKTIEITIKIKEN